MLHIRSAAGRALKAQFADAFNACASCVLTFLERPDVVGRPALLLLFADAKKSGWCLPRDTNRGAFFNRIVCENRSASLGGAEKLCQQRAHASRRLAIVPVNPLAAVARLPETLVN